jgi:hypothetical protein
MEQQTCGSTKHAALRSGRTGRNAYGCLLQSIMGKKIKSREAQLRAEEETLRARLRACCKPKATPAFIGRYSDFPPFYRAKIDAYRPYAIRQPEDWRCQLRSRAPERRFLELVRFTFARYPVAPHLENAWVEDLHLFADQSGERPAARTENAPVGLDFRWRSDIGTTFGVEFDLDKALTH